MTPSELAAKLRAPQPPRLLDVREPEEHAFVALLDSTLIPLGELYAHLDDLESWKDDEVVVYCHHGIRSAQAVAMLRAAGFANVHNLAGGIERWAGEVEPGLPRY